MTTSSRGRILVALHEPGYFRMYGSTIVELERRGWHVSLAFDAPDKRGGTQVPTAAGSNVESLGSLPASQAKWLATEFRLALDYLRYLEPAFKESTYLRRRAEKHLPPRFRFLTRIRSLPTFIVGLVLWCSRAVERCVPVDARVLALVRDNNPDLVFVSPLVTITPRGAGQTEVIKAARRLRVPVIVGVASWDHLTSKGLIRAVPDAVIVWNETQRHEAVALHRIPLRRVIVTGAQSLDHWFESVADSNSSALRDLLGIDRDRDVLLFVGSSLNMAPGESEVRFVRRWLDRLRASPDERLRRTFVIVRPHPSNTRQWEHVDLGDAAVSVHPRRYKGMPLSDEEVETFRQSLLVSRAVIGINTTAMIEAAILGRPVLSVRDEAFEHSQRQTLHFAYLRADDGGFTLVGNTLDEHLAQLGSVLRDGTAEIAAGRAFVERFVRPLGSSQRATDHLADVLERFAGARRLMPQAATALPRSTEATRAGSLSSDQSWDRRT